MHSTDEATLCECKLLIHMVLFYFLPFLIGYLGPPKCRVKDWCYKNKCSNHSACIDRGDSYECKCERPYVGKYCEFKDKCVKNPCHRGGRCRNKNGDFECICPGTRYTGRTCDLVSIHFDLSIISFVILKHLDYIKNHKKGIQLCIYVF